MPRMLTIAEWSRELGISRQAASKAAQRLSLPLREGKLDADLATPAYRAHTRQRVRTGDRQPSWSQVEPGGGRITYDEARRREAVARAQLAENEVEAQAGRLAPISLLTDVLAAASGALVDRLDALPALLRTRVPEMSTRARDEVAAVCAEARNQWIRQTTELVANHLDALAEDDDRDEGGGETG